MMSGSGGAWGRMEEREGREGGSRVEEKRGGGGGGGGRRREEGREGVE